LIAAVRVCACVRLRVRLRRRIYDIGGQGAAIDTADGLAYPILADVYSLDVCSFLRTANASSKVHESAIAIRLIRLNSTSYSSLTNKVQV
jgi:hypothetical protein